MGLKTEVQVQDGFTVHHDKEKFAPGDIFSCDPWEANRLLDAGIVLLVDREEEIEEARKECKAVPQGDVIITEGSLVLAIAGLDPDKSNKAHWTRRGDPRITALEEITGSPVTATDRDVSYAFYLEMQHEENDK